MKVVVEIFTGPLFYIEVEDDATVADLKRKIGAQQALPSDRLIILLDYDEHNHPMITDDQDGVPLVDFGIKDGSKINLLFKLPSNSILPSNSRDHDGSSFDQSIQRSLSAFSLETSL